MSVTFDTMPQAIHAMQATLTVLMDKIDRLEASQPINEPPITGEELRKRLSISRPTEINMRKKGKLPYLLVNGHYRYNWQDVQKKLANL